MESCVRGTSPTLLRFSRFSDENCFSKAILLQDPLLYECGHREFVARLLPVLDDDLRWQYLFTRVYNLCERTLSARYLHRTL